MSPEAPVIPELRLSSRAVPLLGVVVAIAITTAMDASGMSVFSALPLCPLMVAGWYLQRLSRQEIGMSWGRWRHHSLALLYPLAVMGPIAAAAWIAGAVDLSATDWHKARLNLVLVAVSATLVALITEEGFFRGWLWASLRRAGHGEGRTLALSSLAFSLWHLSAVSLDTGFDLPAPQIPVFMVNAAVIGAAWGALRMLSGSIMVCSLSHGAWNALAYVLFGFGTKVGALGVEQTALYGPEVGALGLALNVVLLAAVGLLWRSRKPSIL